MSDDFLSSLAAQALGTASAVRPRVASRFEPRPAGGDLHRRWPEPAEIEFDASPAPIPPASEARRPDLATISSMAGRAMPWDIEPEKRAPIDTIPRPGLTAAPRHAERAGGLGSLSVSARREPAPGPPAEVAPAHGERASGPEGAGVTAPPKPGREPAPVPPVPAHAADEAPQRPPSVTREAAQSSRTDDPIRQGAIRPPTVVPEIRPARHDTIPVQSRRAAREIPSPQAPADTGPTIQVTIGRVEVRAMASPAAQPVKHPASPVMTLEEYLRRKTERGSS